MAETHGVALLRIEMNKKPRDGFRSAVAPGKALQIDSDIEPRTIENRGFETHDISPPENLLEAAHGL